MAVVIRLRRTGRKNLPCFRITVTDSRFPRDGRSLETLGLYDPLRKDAAAQLTLNQERAAHWLAHGAKPSEIVLSLFKRLKVFPVKPKVIRKRPGRVKKSAKRITREKVEAARLEAKAARLVARKQQKKAAAAALPAETKKS